MKNKVAELRRYEGTIIVGVNSTAQHVEILYHPMGAEYGW